MHILLIHQAFASIDEPGGTRHHELSKHLAALGDKITIVASPVSYLTGQAKQPSHKTNKNTREDDIKIIRAWTIPSLHKSFAWRVFSFFSFMFSSFFMSLTVPKVDVVWGTSPPLFQGVTAWLLARIKRVPFLFEVRDLWPAFAVAVGVLKNSFLIRLSEWLEGFLYKHADHVMINSPGFSDHVSSRGAKAITLIPNGADPDMFTPESSGKTFRKKYNLQDFFVVLYAGAHGISNDLSVVLDAANVLKDKNKIRIVLLGDGKEKPNLVSQAEINHLDNVLFLPPIPKAEMPSALSAVDACLAILKPIDLYKTTYPNKVFDYMAAGKPVVLAIDGVIRKVVEQANAGVFVPPGDPDALAKGILKLFHEPKKAEEMGRNGYVHVKEHFSRTVIAEKLHTLLLSL
jgi:glycosyltransferase involved in cell wall biosynthesis